MTQLVVLANAYSMTPKSGEAFLVLHGTQPKREEQSQPKPPDPNVFTKKNWSSTETTSSPSRTIATITQFEPTYHSVNKTVAEFRVTGESSMPPPPPKPPYLSCCIIAAVFAADKLNSRFESGEVADTLGKFDGEAHDQYTVKFNRVKGKMPSCYDKNGHSFLHLSIVLCLNHTVINFAEAGRKIDDTRLALVNLLSAGSQVVTFIIEVFFSFVSIVNIIQTSRFTKFIPIKAKKGIAYNYTTSDYNFGRVLKETMLTLGMVRLCISAFALPMHVLFNWLLLVKLGGGLIGAAIPLTTSWCVIIIDKLLFIFITKSEVAWNGFTGLTVAGLFGFVKLSLVSAAVILGLEFWYMMVHDANVSAIAIYGYFGQTKILGLPNIVGQVFMDLIKCIPLRLRCFLGSRIKDLISKLAF